MLDGAAQAARVRFRTRDGREAVRPLGAAAELVPTLEALLVTFGPASGPSDAAPAGPAPSTAPPGRGKPAREAEEQTNALAASLVFGAGGRLAAAPGAYLGPHLDVQGQAYAGPWVAGVLVESVPSHVALSAVPDGFTLMTYGVSLAFGRRHALDSVSLGYAARVGVQVLAEEAPPQPGVPSARSLEVWQPRVGVEGYGLVPLVDRFALRFGASVDTPVARFANPAAESRALPSFPRLGATASIGIEARLL